MDPGEVAREIAGECVAVRLRLLNRAVTNFYDEALRPFGLRISQLNVLTAIAARGPLRASDLTSRLCMDKSTLSRDLERLIKHGWVEAHPAEDRRSQTLQATALGLELVRRSKPAWLRAQEQAKAL